MTTAYYSEVTLGQKNGSSVRALIGLNETTHHALMSALDNCAEEYGDKAVTPMRVEIAPVVKYRE
jgi:hypothetical protein